MISDQKQVLSDEPCLELMGKHTPPEKMHSLETRSSLEIPWVEGMVEAVLKKICHTARIDVRKPVDNIIRLFFQCVNIIDEPEQLARKICWVVV